MNLISNNELAKPNRATETLFYCFYFEINFFFVFLFNHEILKIEKHEKMHTLVNLNLSVFQNNRPNVIIKK